MGRPSKLTPELQERIVQAIRAGNYVATAVAYAGISQSTFYRWMERGKRQRGGRFREFWEAIARAEAEAEVRNVALIQKEAQKNAVHAEWWLERRFPDRWGRREIAVEHRADDELTTLLKRFLFGGETSAAARADPDTSGGGPSAEPD